MEVSRLGPGGAESGREPTGTSRRFLEEGARVIHQGEMLLVSRKPAANAVQSKVEGGEHLPEIIVQRLRDVTSLELALDDSPEGETPQSGRAMAEGAGAGLF
jgi:hypothetical protein